MLDFSVAAVSASDTITDLGAYAGIAAILGLAVLSVLMFAQARELKRLREWAGRAPERAAEMQERLLADAQRRVVAQPVPVTRTPAASPATPAAAAAVAAAAAKSPSSPPPAGVTGAVTAGVPSGASAAPSGPSGPSGSGPGAKSPAPSVPGALTVPDDATQAIPVVPASAARPPMGPPLRPASAAALPSLHRGEAEDPPSHARTTVAVVGGVVGTLAIAFVLITQVFGGDDDPASTADRTRTASVKTATTTTPRTTATGAPANPAIAKVVRGDFKVFVLNSTDRNGAARESADKLKSSGFEIQGTGQAVTQTMDITQVAYKEGSKRAALEVAMLLGVSPADVILADQSTLVAGGMANVVVTLGADKVK